MTSAPISLRNGRPSDLDAILSLDRATETAPHWPAAIYQAILDTVGSTRCLIVAERSTEDGPHLAGFAVGLVHHISPITAELEDVVVAADCRRTGIGRQLCAAVIQWARSCGAVEITLEVRAASSAGIALYTSLGFTPQATRCSYYSNPLDDAKLMRLGLT